MRVADAGSTNPELMKLLADMAQAEAWREFMGRYSPMIRSICSGWGLNRDEIEDVQQQVMLCLVKTFLSEENRIRVSFRGFLKSVIATEIFNFLRSRDRLGELRSLEFFMMEEFAARGKSLEYDLEHLESCIFNRLEGIQRILSNVKAQVQKSTWKTFWKISVQGMKCEDVANEDGIYYLTAYQRNLRVLEMIRREAGLGND